MKFAIITLSALLLIGCGNPAKITPSVPSVPTTPAVVDVPSFLFSTQSRDILVTIITDLYDRLSGAILRTAHPNGGLVDARDHYQVNSTKNCTEVHMVDTYQYDPDKTWLRYQQEYPTSPCWVGSLTATVGIPVTSNAVNNAPYYWRQFDKDGNQIGADFIAGKWDDHTTLLCTTSTSCYLTEYYLDKTNPDPATFDPYCVQGTYDSKGLAKLAPGDPTLCKP